MIWPIEHVFFSRDVIFKETFFLFKCWFSNTVPPPALVDDSMLPSHTCVSDQPSPPIFANAPLPIVFAEFSPPFNICDTIVPPDEYFDLVHSDTSLPSVSPAIIPIIGTAIPLRQSFRVHRPPTYLRDHHYNLVSTSVLASASLISSNDSNASSSGILYPLSSTLSYDHSS